MTDKKLHSLIDQLNPNLRSIDNVGGKVRVREFYAMSPEQAYSILETIAILGGHRDRLKLWEPSVQEKKDEDLAQEIEEEHIERQSPFAFSKCNIPVGANITYFNRGKANSGLECVVVDDKAVEYQGKKYSLSALATELSGSKHGVAGPRYFKYKGEWLNTIRARVEGRQDPARVEDVWIIPCNPKLYDIVGAFEKLDTIEWSQTNNTSVGDTIYIYVGGEYKAIMYKCEVLETELYGNRSDEDLEFYKTLSVKSDVEEKLAALENAYKAADALIESEFSSLRAEGGTLAERLSALEASYREADEALWAGIRQVQENLDALQQLLEGKDSALENKLNALIAEQEKTALAHKIVDIVLIIVVTALVVAVIVGAMKKKNSEK